MEPYNFEPKEPEHTLSDYRKEEAYLRAKKKVEALVGFYWHLAIYIVVNIFLILVVGLKSDSGFTGFGTYATAIFWGVGLLFHFIGVFGPDLIFGRDWEERKIKDFMKKEDKRWE